MTFGRPTIAQRQAQRAAEKTANLQALATVPAHALHRGTYAGTSSGSRVEKENASQSAAYMAAVRALGYCMRCGCTLPIGKRQFCHADQGKGERIKTDVRRGWLGCAGCHFHVGTSGRMPKVERRAEEDQLAAKTRGLVLRAGTWPKNLPHLKETPCA